MDMREIRELLRQVDAKAGSDTFLYDLRDVLIKHGRIDDAITVCKRIILCVAPEDRETKSLAWSDLASLLYRADRTEEALAAAKTAKQLDEKSSEAWEYIALTSWRKNELDDAIGGYVMALKTCSMSKQHRRSYLFWCYSMVLKDAGREEASIRYQRVAAALAAHSQDGALLDALPDGCRFPSTAP